MSLSYDLLTEPWIPVIRGSELIEINLTDVLHSAHDIFSLSDSLPIAEFGMYRFLVALVMDIFEIMDSRCLEDLLDKRRFDPTQIDEYFQLWGHCFNLFDADRPFLQTAGMDSQADKPLACLLPCVPSGTNSSHFHHLGETSFAVSPAVAARLLTTMSPFMTAGGAGLAPSINGAPPWYALIEGDNLFQTICLNCYTGPKKPNGDAPVAWRNPLPPKTDGRCTSTSLLEALTWRPRQIQLIAGQSGVCSITSKHSDVLVHGMKFRAGASCDFTWTDPSVPYKISDRGPLVMRPQEGKEIWRDTGPLALLNNRAYESTTARLEFHRPLIIDQFERLTIDCLNRKTPLTLTYYGMRTDMKMKIFEWYKESLSVPAPMVVGSKFALFAQDCMDLAGRVEYALKKAIKHLARDDGKGNAKALDSLIANTTRQYWSLLRPIYFKMLNELAAIPTTDHAEAVFRIGDDWKEHLRGVVMHVFKVASDDRDTYGKDIKRKVEAETKLTWELRDVFETPEQKDARKNKFKKATGLVG